MKLSDLQNMALAIELSKIFNMTSKQLYMFYLFISQNTIQTHRPIKRISIKREKEHKYIL